MGDSVLVFRNLTACKFRWDTESFQKGVNVLRCFIHRFRYNCHSASRKWEPAQRKASLERAITSCADSKAKSYIVGAATTFGRQLPPTCGELYATLASACTVRALPSSLISAREKGAPIDVHPEVEQALVENRPLVALETTIVTHGMPYPVNLDTAKSVERRVRSAGAIPATIGVIEGRVKIGLELAQLAYLADSRANPGSVKLSRRDISAAIALKKTGGTTCSATLIFAALAGIKVFATGGLGGVHRGGQDSMDISADLQELARCPVGLVSAGVKSILDIGRTLEYLETLGVPVVTYGETEDFPAFYSPSSGFKSPWRVNDPFSAANILFTQRGLGMTNGVLFGTPIPESYTGVGMELQEAVEQAVQESQESGMDKRGKEVTPWLLERVRVLTSGKSLASNIALIENTARKGAQIAVAYAELIERQGSGPKRTHVVAVRPRYRCHASSSNADRTKLLVVGSIAIDVISQARVTSDTDGSRGRHITIPGTVGLHLGVPNSTPSATVLVSSVGDDTFGRLLVKEMRRIGMRTDGIMTSRQRSAVCNMVLDGLGDLIGGVADMDIVQSIEPESVVSQIIKHEPVLVALDANVSSDVLKAVTQHCNTANITSNEPTSLAKSVSILPAISSALGSNFRGSPVKFASPNLLELAELYRSASMDPWQLTSHEYWWRIIDDFSIGTEFRASLDQLARQDALGAASGNGNKTLSFLVERGVAQMAVNLLPFFQHLVIKCGALGVLLAMRFPADTPTAWAGERSDVRRRQIVAHGKGETVVIKHYPAHGIDPRSVISVTGAGDSLVGAILAALAQDLSAFGNPESLDDVIKLGQSAAIETLRSPFAVSLSLST
ncbi:indigoidine synthase A-like protein [Russula earlei]|uniref:Indigoidine synthase A-like protein n=1 Tax=Russula earlei TaxID=71964 RepID=A0ACC0UQ01_9AGAM|nr:indigoidine synthase A-like protein [Russula earlei]